MLLHLLSCNAFNGCTSDWQVSRCVYKVFFLTVTWFIDLGSLLALEYEHQPFASEGSSDLMLSLLCISMKRPHQDGLGGSVPR